MREGRREVKRERESLSGSSDGGGREKACMYICVFNGGGPLLHYWPRSVTVITTANHYTSFPFPSLMFKYSL